MRDVVRSSFIPTTDDETAHSSRVKFRVSNSYLGRFQRRSHQFYVALGRQWSIRNPKSLDRALG